MFVLFGLLITNVSFACGINSGSQNDCPPIDPTPISVIDTDPKPTPDPTPEPEPVPEPEVRKRSSGGYCSDFSLPCGKYLQKPASAQPTVYVWDVVKFGDKGENVKTLQMYLNNKGASLVVDGIYGPLTLAAFGSFK